MTSAEFNARLGALRLKIVRAIATLRRDNPVDQGTIEEILEESLWLIEQTEEPETRPSSNPPQEFW